MIGDGRLGRPREVLSPVDDARTRRPVDVIGHGHTALVEEAARAFADGSYV